MSSIPAEAIAIPSVPAEHSGVLTRAPVRIGSIDALRGFVILLMALDHVRSYFTSATFDPLDLAQTNVALFFTRWVTHLCAPTFIFLAGLSAYLMAQRLEAWELRRFLITRGLWLVALEFTVVQFAWSFNLRYDNGLFLQVIWAIGASMVVLAAIVSWPRWLLATIAVALIAGHNLLDGVLPETFGRLDWVWMLLHQKAQTHYAFILYPLVPWVGVMILGFCAGSVFELDDRKRRALLLTFGSAALLAFVVIRAINVYGDPHPWTVQPSAALTVLSFFNVYKYPPSLAYLLVTLGIGVLLLAAFETLRGKPLELLRTFGRVPLFVYVVHIVLAHLAAGLLALAMGFGDQLLTNLFLYPPKGWGFGLVGVYIAWLAVIAALYPACRWFAKVKRTREEWWMAYL
jgi:uncharacterized membrane protein